MKAIVACVCDHAWVENGCLSVVRAFDTITGPQYPHTFPRLSIAIRLLFRRSEAGDHTLGIFLSDADGKKIMKAEIKMEMKVPQEESVSESSFSFALNGQNVTFPRPGEYVVDIVVDGRAETSVPIYARQKK